MQQAHDTSADANGNKGGEGGLPPRKPHKPLAPIKSKPSGKYSMLCSLVPDVCNTHAVGFLCMPLSYQSLA